MAGIVFFRRGANMPRKKVLARWRYLPWQPLAMLALIAATFLSIQLVSFSTHGFSRELASPPSADSSVPRRIVIANVPMPLCKGWPRVNCVIDGDTIWFYGEKIRIADINAPETHDPRCAYEAALGHKATDRMIQLLNAGPFEIVAANDSDEDIYGRKLRLVERNGISLGMVLVHEGLAERWRGYRRDWCA